MQPVVVVVVVVVVAVDLAAFGSPKVYSSALWFNRGTSSVLGEVLIESIILTCP